VRHLASQLKVASLDGEGKRRTSLVRPEALSHTRQIAVLRGVAHEAPTAFDIRARRLRLLRYARNAVFRVDVGRGRWLVRRVLGRRPPIGCPSARTVERSGAVLAEIHEQGRAMRLPRSLRPPHADWDRFAEDGLKIPRRAQAHLGRAAGAGLQRQMARARSFLAGVRESTDGT